MLTPRAATDQKLWRIVSVIADALCLQVRLQYYPDGYEWAEDAPVLISEGYGGHAAGVGGRQALPNKFNVSRGQSLQGIHLNRQIVSEWADEKVPQCFTCLPAMPIPH